jgi:hypothetical protein
MDIANNDILMIDIDNMIHNKKKLLLEKRNELIDSERNNEFLREVVDDYTNYYNKIKMEKQKQYETLLFLTDYNHRMNNTINETGYLVNESKKQREKLIQKIKNIKEEIDNL